VIATSTTNIFEAYLLASWFLGLCAVVDVVLQPRASFVPTGRSKVRWFGIELAGAPLFGVFTWAHYIARVRPRLDGGRRPRVLLRGLFSFLKILDLRFWEQGRPNGPSRPTQGNESSDPGWKSPGATKQCPTCDGIARTGCSVCNNTGFVANYNDPNGPDKPCARCQGQAGGVRCPTCHATGRVPA
jgi:hypothetical protein